jgi:hypothetical protein
MVRSGVKDSGGGGSHVCFVLLAPKFAHNVDEQGLVDDVIRVYRD